MFKQLNWWQRLVTALFVTTLCVAMVHGVLGLTRGIHQNRIIASGDTIQSHLLSMNRATEVRLTQWVYDHSARISRAQCLEIVREAMKYRYPELLLSIMELESIKFTPGAVSSIGAVGWCQINVKEHGKELIAAGIIKEVRDLWDTGPNIKAASYILDQKLKRGGGDIARGLEGYLGGRDGKYVLRILSNYANLTVKMRS